MSLIFGVTKSSVRLCKGICSFKCNVLDVPPTGTCTGNLDIKINSIFKYVAIILVKTEYSQCSGLAPYVALVRQEPINYLYVLQVMLHVVMQTEDVCQAAVHISYSHAAC
jgi:hypothetical protein